MSPLVSIIICTRNRGNDLRWTLETIGELDVPSDLPAEVLVVDNGSTGHTPEVVHHIKMLRMVVRCGICFIGTLLTPVSVEYVLNHDCELGYR